jgi:hypothetical protein
MAVKIRPLTRIWRKSRITSTCWLFEGCKVRGGYGWFRDENGLCAQVHRWVYQYVHRKVLPIEVGVLHTCDTPNCWRPSHLFEGTQAVNVYDCIKKDRRYKGKLYIS